MNAHGLKKILFQQANRKKAKVLKSFFKTSPGGYAERDVFLGVSVPEIRKIANKNISLNLSEIVKLLKSKIHEARLLALIILVAKYNKGSEKDRNKICKLYLSHTKYINSWDLVDLSAHHILGAHFEKEDKNVLYQLAKSDLIWSRRIAIVTTLYFVRNNEFSQTLKIAEILLNDSEDLIQKAVGWMLREVGKRSLILLKKFLQEHYKEMPRTMLRYAIEKFPEKEREAYLKIK